MNILAGCIAPTAVFMLRYFSHSCFSADRQLKGNRWKCVHFRDYGAQFDSETLVNYSDVVRWEDFFHCNIISTIDCHLQHCYVCIFAVILTNIDLQMDFQLVSNFSVCTKPHGNHHRAAGDDHGGDDDDQYHDDD